MKVACSKLMESGSTKVPVSTLLPVTRRSWEKPPGSKLLTVWKVVQAVS